MFQLNFLLPVPPQVEEWEKIWRPYYDGLSSLNAGLRKVEGEEAFHALLTHCRRKMESRESLARDAQALDEALLERTFLPIDDAGANRSRTDMAGGLILPVKRMARLFTRKDLIGLEIQLLARLIDEHGLSVASSPVIIEAFNQEWISLSRKLMPILAVNEALFIKKFLCDLAELLGEGETGTHTLKRKLKPVDDWLAELVTSFLMGAQLEGKKLYPKHKPFLQAETTIRARESGHSNIFSKISFNGKILKQAKFDALIVELDWTSHLDPHTGTIPVTDREVSWFDGLLDRAVRRLEIEQRELETGFLEEITDPELLSDPQVGPAETFLENEAFRSLIAHLPNETQTALGLRISGYTSAEIAEEQGISLDAVNGRIKRAKTSIKQKIEAREK